MILFSVAETTFAIAANSIDEIREVAGLQDFSFGMPHPKLAKVTHVLARDCGRCFVVDGRAHFHLPAGKSGRVMVLRHAPAAVLVDAIDRMQEIQLIHALPDAFVGEERNWYRGLTLIKGKVVPVVRPEAFLSKAETTLLSVALRNTEVPRGLPVTV